LIEKAGTVPGKKNQLRISEEIRLFETRKDKKKRIYISSVSHLLNEIRIDTNSQTGFLEQSEAAKIATRRESRTANRRRIIVSNRDSSAILSKFWRNKKKRKNRYWTICAIKKNDTECLGLVLTMKMDLRIITSNKIKTKCRASKAKLTFNWYTTVHEGETESRTRYTRWKIVTSVRYYEKRYLRLDQFALPDSDYSVSTISN